MSSRVYWNLILYFCFSRLMLSDWDGWMDALGTTLWIAATVYMAYNMEWNAYKNAMSTEHYEEKGKDGKVRTGVRLIHRDRDIVQDVGQWIVWLTFLFILDLFDITIVVMLIIVSFILVMVAAAFAREIYDVVKAWCVLQWKYCRLAFAKADRAVQRFFR